MSAELAVPRDDEFITGNTNRRTIELPGFRVLFPRDSDTARYNAAVVGELIVLREVSLANVQAGIPDRGTLPIYRSTPDKIEKIAQLDLIDSNVSNWEDARAFRYTDEVGSEKAVLGLTAIRASDNKPVAATVRGSIIDGNFVIEQESLVVYLNDEGKNVTPISPTEFLFRREGARDSLEIVEAGKDEDGKNKLRVKNVIKFPKKSWCEWQIGTQAHFLPGGILPVHGVNRFTLAINPETGEETFGHTYSMGLAQIVNGKVVKITDKPLFTRGSFKHILPMGTELDPNKDVIYCCGYSVERDIVRFVINIGDLMTVEVSKSLTELQVALDCSSPVLPEQIPSGIAA